MSAKDFDDAKALDLLDEAEAAISAYELHTGRSFTNDRDMRNRLSDHEDGQTLLDGLDVDNAMVAFYDAGVEVSVWGDAHESEYLYFKHVGEVSDAMEELGILQEEPEDEDDGDYDPTDAEQGPLEQGWAETRRREQERAPHEGP